METQVPSKQGGASRDIYQETKSQSFAEQNHKISELQGALEVSQGDPFNLLIRKQAQRRHRLAEWQRWVTSQDSRIGAIVCHIPLYLLARKFL